LQTSVSASFAETLMQLKNAMGNCAYDSFHFR
jgi:hypothetical protein